MNLSKENEYGKRFGNRKSLIIALALLILLTAFCYKNYWGNVWYLQDDYITVDFGGAGSIWDAGEKITSIMYQQQKRYQPVRLYLFSIATHFFPEEYSFFYNFGLHLVNVILLFFLLRAIRVYDYTALMIAVLFSVYGVYRMMESPSAMIGGSGLSAFFMLATFSLLTAGMQSSSFRRKYLFLIFSYLSYTGLVFSYEVAFPMLATITCWLMFFNIFPQPPPFPSSRRYLILTPYLGTLIFYYLFFRQPSNYEGAQIHFSLDILTRFLAYSNTLLIPFAKFHLSLRKEVFLFLLVYYPAVYWLLKQKSDHKDSSMALDSPRICFFLFLFGLIWYLASVLLFSLNNWISPTSVMHHHLYLMTIGVALFFSEFFFGIAHLLTSPARKYFVGLLIYFLFPLFIINSLHFNLQYGEGAAEKTRVLLAVKKQIQNYVGDVRHIDALLLKNFLKPHNLHYYQISNLNGAFLQWFSFEKYIESGDDILSAKGNQITFQGPLSYYGHILHSKTLQYADGRIEILYYDSATQKLLPYESGIDFTKGINLHQTDQVRSSMELRAETDPIQAILRNQRHSHFLIISFREPIARDRLSASAAIALNDSWTKEIYWFPKAIAIELSPIDRERKYLFLYLDFPEQPELLQKIAKLSLGDSAKGVKLSSLPDMESEIPKYEPRYRIGTSIRLPSPAYAEFINWYDAEPTHRWARGQKGAISLQFGNLNPRVTRYMLILKGFTLYQQELIVRLNGVVVTKLINDGSKKTWQIPVDAKILRSNSFNLIEFETPGARRPSGSDERILGFAFQELRFISARFF